MPPPHQRSPEQQRWTSQRKSSHKQAHWQTPRVRLRSQQSSFLNDRGARPGRCGGGGSADPSLACGADSQERCSLSPTPSSSVPKQLVMKRTEPHQLMIKCPAYQALRGLVGHSHPPPRDCPRGGSPGANPRSPPVRANLEPPGSHAPPPRSGSPPHRSSPWPGSGSADTPPPPPGPPQVGGGHTARRGFLPLPHYGVTPDPGPHPSCALFLLPHWKGGHIPHLLTLGWGGDSISKLSTKGRATRNLSHPLELLPPTQQG